MLSYGSDATMYMIICLVETLPFCLVVEQRWTKKERTVVASVQMWCHEIEQLCQPRPPLTKERTLRCQKSVGWRARTFRLDSRIQFYSVNKRVEVNTMIPRKMFHGKPAAVDVNVIVPMKNTKFCWMSVGPGEQNLENRFIASHRCSVTLVMPGWLVLVDPLHYSVPQAAQP